MSVKSMLAACGLTAEQVEKAAKKYANRKPEPTEMETGDDLVEAINENRPESGLPDFALSADIMYHGAPMQD